MAGVLHDGGTITHPGVLPLQLRRSGIVASGRPHAVFAVTEKNEESCMTSLLFDFHRQIL